MGCRNTMKVILVLAILIGSSGLMLFGQDLTADQVAAANMKELRSVHLRLITDLPITDEIRELPVIFDLAMRQWSEFFGKEIPNLEQWQATAFLIGDRERFRQSGMIKSGVPDFKDGYQAGSWLYFVEQPSAYYRRHLLLHEGTHWFMSRLFGSAGPPWYMEGMAERLGTHRWDGKELKLGIIPANNDDVPYWGRLKLMQDDLTRGSAPSLEEILNMEGSARLPVERYAWSWAAVLFFSEHPEWNSVLKELTSIKLDGSAKLSSELMERLRGDWPRIRVAWNGFITDLDYGFTLPASIPIVAKTQKPLSAQGNDLVVESNLGWQSAGIVVKAGDRIAVNSKGRYTIARNGEEWPCEPQGVSIEYFKSRPFGELLATVARTSSSVQQTEVWKTIPIGRSATFEAPHAGVLMLKINDDPHQLSENTGNCRVHIERAK